MKQNETFKNLEFAQVLQGGKQVLYVRGEDLPVNSKYGLQAYIGEKLGDGLFSIRYKEKASDKSKHMNVRSIMEHSRETKPNNSIIGMEFFFNRFNDLEKNFEKVLAKLDNSKEENFQLRLKALETEKSEGIDLSGLITQVATVLLKNKLNGGAVPVNLQDSPGGSEKIPDDIKAVLSAIDWEKVTKDQKDLILNLFDKYKNLIPLKG